MKKILALWTVIMLLSAGLLAHASQPGYKDTLVVATYSEQDTLDPQVNVTNDKVLRLLYDGLLEYLPDGKIGPSLAETWQHSDDYMTWTFNLKKGVKFASGKEMTSKDVVATFARLTDKQNALRYTDSVSFIASVTALDDYTVQIKLAHPYGAVEATLATQYCFILDADYIAKYGKDIGIDPATINGTGPYKIATWDADEQMVFTANEYWHGGKPGCANLIYKVIPEASARSIAIEVGEIDILDRPAVDDVARLKNIAGLKIFAKPGYGLSGFQFNCSEKSICQDPKIRQAISYALDRESLINSLFADIEEKATHGPLVPQNLGYFDFGVIKQDQQKAKQLMAQAGHLDGFDLFIMTYAGYNKGVEDAEVIKAQLAEVGINVKIETVDGATFNSVLNGITPEEFPWDMFIMGYGGSTLDPDASLRRVFVTSEDGRNSNNYGWYSNKRVDELLLGAIQEMDWAKRFEMYKEAQRILYIDDPVAVYLQVRNSIYVLRDTVENFSINGINVPEYENIKVKDGK